MVLHLRRFLPAERDVANADNGEHQRRGDETPFGHRRDVRAGAEGRYRALALGPELPAAGEARFVGDALGACTARPEAATREAGGKIPAVAEFGDAGLGDSYKYSVQRFT